MHAPRTPSIEPAANPNVDEYLRQEGLSDEEWKRIYDLRYCTILVPFEEDADKGKSAEDQEDQVSDEDHIEYHQPSTPAAGARQRSQLATPKTPRHSSAVNQQAKTLERHRALLRPTGLLTPAEKRAQKSVIRDAVEKLSVGISADQDNDDDDDDVDLNDESKGFLTDNDPLSTYLTAPRDQGCASDQSAPENSTAPTMSALNDDDADVTDAETFHDALDEYEDSETESHLESGHTDTFVSCGSSSTAGIKRRRWELDSPPGLLQQRQVGSVKRVAIRTSTATTTAATLVRTAGTPAGLLRPRTFTPTQTPRRSSISSEVSAVSTEDFKQTALWTTQDWRDLEKVYHELRGNSMAESDTGKYATREPTLLTTGLRGSHRHSNPPYPVHDGHGLRAGTSRRGGSSAAISEFLERRRADRSQRQRTEDQNYQLKSVFKHRLASGLKTVGQLLPFWRDVEQGNTDIKEKVPVPLVPAGQAQAVIEAFETQDQESDGSGTFSRAGSTGRRGGTPVLSTHGQETVAEMLARGHAVQSKSVSSQGL
ncbi:hypothetical protein BGZ99_002987 [Dissophora globulifera]|uniref:Uncharacterized protein n=1 Tax=Dissophora globulifera TaxID=979702 RepID=A0A9P6RMG4_9FUNG|nr:hypothetical protein BGZ99_002987 [Dissophora globulifera]